MHTIVEVPLFGDAGGELSGPPIAVDCTGAVAEHFQEVCAYLMCPVMTSPGGVVEQGCDPAGVV
jgi:hypothetical protein